MENNISQIDQIQLQAVPNFLALQNAEAEANQFALQCNMLQTSTICDNCNQAMALKPWKSAHGIEEGHYYCNRCKSYASRRRGTIFENMRISYHMFFVLLTYFLDNTSKKKTVQYLAQNFGENETNRKITVAKYFRLFRQVIHWKISEQINNLQLSGSIEIDESLVFKPKKGYPFARPLQIQYWVMGLFCRETRQYIIIPVANRRRETLLAVIAKHVIPGSTIYSDNWSGYFNLQTHPKQSYLEPMGYRHFGINHSKRFVNFFNNRIHTNTIERCWRSLKAFTKIQQPKKELDSYISQYIFEGLVEKKDRMHTLIKYINELKI